ncbi:MAG: ECF transporter S component [Firmicutes bacterium]|nr:ECF transporter S component [Bacillota bacterium]
MKNLTRIAVLTSLTAVATMVVNIPLPHVKGYINVGDGVILFTGLLLGPAAGAVAGGAGSVLADLILGYPHWAAWTLVIKGLEGLLAGLLAERAPLAVTVGAGTMAAGYFIAGTIMYGSIGPALAQLPFDLTQGAVGGLAALALLKVLRNYLQR